ncbi:diguanylate cyclase domain-containing protein [Fischerella thermalis]
MGRQRGQGIIKNLDGLTQIANRRRFDKYLSQEWRPIAREQQY